MTKEIKMFNTIDGANLEKKRRAGTWRPLHTDFVNDKVRITFVNGSDDPDNSLESQNRRIEFNRMKALGIKLKDDTISFNEVKELLRIRL